jgi:hypothetical protein
MVINTKDGKIITRPAYKMAVIAERAFRDEIISEGLYHSEWVYAFSDFQMLLDAINVSGHDYELRWITIR